MMPMGEIQVVWENWTFFLYEQQERRVRDGTIFMPSKIIPSQVNMDGKFRRQLQ